MQVFFLVLAFGLLVAAVVLGFVFRVLPLAALALFAAVLIAFAAIFII
jgi:hypothetical protein